MLQEILYTQQGNIKQITIDFTKKANKNQTEFS